MSGTVTIDISSYNKLLLAYKAMERVESLVAFEYEEATKRAMKDANNGEYPCGGCYVSAKDLCDLMNLDHFETFEALRGKALKIYNNIKKEERNDRENNGNE